jgi:hypothetical protein
VCIQPVTEGFYCHYKYEEAYDGNSAFTYLTSLCYVRSYNNFITLKYKRALESKVQEIINAISNPPLALMFIGNLHLVSTEAASNVDVTATHSLSLSVSV